MSEQQKKGRLGEVIRFVVTGGVCFLIEQAVLSLLKEIFGLDVNIGTPIAFLVSVVANYLLCVKWVFPGADGSGGQTKGGLCAHKRHRFLPELGHHGAPDRAFRAGRHSADPLRHPAESLPSEQGNCDPAGDGLELLHKAADIEEEVTQGALPLDPTKGSSTLWTPFRAIQLVTTAHYARVLIRHPFPHASSFPL